MDDKVSELPKHTVKTESCGELAVYVQGDLEQAKKEEDVRCVFLTVHDMGANQESMIDFASQACMSGIRQRCVFLHVVVPGQEREAEDIPESAHFPTMQELGNDLIYVLDQLNVKYILGLGEGAGANIITRFGMKHPTRCLGLILIHPTSTTAGVMEHFKDKIINWKLGSIGHNPTAEHYLVFHKFGQRVEAAGDKLKAMEEFKNTLHKQINPKNLKRYVESFMNRTDISHLLKDQLTCDTLLLVGSKSSFLHSTETMHIHSNKTKTSLLRIDDVGDVLDEAPEKVCQSLLLFCQGLGLLTSLGIGGHRSRSGSECSGDGRRSGSMSMEAYDKPNVKRFSLSAKGDSGDS